MILLFLFSLVLTGLVDVTFKSTMRNNCWLADDKKQNPAVDVIAEMSVAAAHWWDGVLWLALCRQSTARWTTQVRTTSASVIIYLLTNLSSAVFRCLLRLLLWFSGNVDVVAPRRKTFSGNSCINFLATFLQQIDILVKMSSSLLNVVCTARSKLSSDVIASIFVPKV